MYKNKVTWTIEENRVSDTTYKWWQCDLMWINKSMILHKVEGRKIYSYFYAKNYLHMNKLGI